MLENAALLAISIFHFYLYTTSRMGDPPIKWKMQGGKNLTYENSIIWEYSCHKGLNHDGILTCCGIISHGECEEKLFLLPMGIIPEVFVHELFGNVAQTQWEHFPLLTHLKLY